jgi:hypothetical protein
MLYKELYLSQGIMVSSIPTKQSLYPEKVKIIWSTVLVCIQQCETKNKVASADM